MDKIERLFKLVKFLAVLFMILVIYWMSLEHNPVSLKTSVEYKDFSAEISCDFASVASGNN